MLSSEASDRDKVSVSPRRGVTYQKLVETLKAKVYQAGAQNIIAA